MTLEGLIAGGRASRFVEHMDRATLQRGLRWGMRAGIVVVIGAYVSVLFQVADVTGVVAEFAVVLLGAAALATLLARFERAKTTSTALAATAVLLFVGAVVYLFALSPSERAMITSTQLLTDTYGLLTGMSVLQIIAAGSWVLAVLPAPTFLGWYLALRGDYSAALVASGSLLGMLVLTGDAGTVPTLVGVVGAVSVFALESLLQTVGSQSTRSTSASNAARFTQDATDRDIRPLWRHVRAQLELVTVVLAAMILVVASVGGAIGTGTSSAGGSDGGDGGAGISQASLVNTTDQLSATGPISLSPQVRFLVHSNQSARWQTAAYDRYTGDGWVRTGRKRPYEDGLDGPPGATDRVEQTVEPRTRLGAMPAASRPVAVDDEQANQTVVTSQGTIEPSEPLGIQDNYTVVSQQPAADPETLRAADDYGSEMDRYQQLPESIPDRVHERSAAVAGEESTAYDKAVTIERYLKANKSYSTLVQEPEGDVADGFLFEMEAGYCTYFATTMAVMLRSQDVPARVAVGYTPGQRLESENGTDVHVVRGYDAHVWVEVYFEDVGWVAFDPTPSEPRLQFEYSRLREAREQGTIADVDAAGSSRVDINQSTWNASNTDIALDQLGSPAAASDSTDEGIQLPEPRTVGLWIVGLVGAAAITRRNRLVGRGRDALGQYYQRRQSATVDTERAWQRIEAELQRAYRPRKPSESARSYVYALETTWDLDSRVEDVAQWYEQAKYGGEVDQATADAAVTYADELTRRRLPLVGRRYQ